MFENLKHEITMPEGWQEEWIGRTSVVLDYYSNAVYFGLTTLSFIIILASAFSVRSCKKELELNPSNRAEVFNKWDKKTHQSCKKLFYVAGLFLVNTLVIQGVDSYIGFTSMQADVEAEPALWNKSFVAEIGLYCVLLMVIWAATFFLVPLAQVFLISAIVRRHGRKYRLDSLSNFIVAARSGTTYLALMWSVIHFILIRWWAPTGGPTLLRFVAMTACFGSYMTWMDASFMFNFRTDALEGQELRFSERNLREMMKLLTATAITVHTKPVDPEKLPLFVKVDQTAKGFPNEKLINY